MSKLNAIVVDDEADAREILVSLLNDTGKVKVIREISDALKVESAINALKPDVIFIDIEMPGIDGLSVIENIRSYNHNLEVVFVTAYSKYSLEAIKLDVASYLLKPVDRGELSDLINRFLCKRPRSKQEKKNPNKTKSPF